MTDEAPAGRPHSAPSYTPFFIAILTPFAVAIAAAALPDLTAHPLARAALALVAAAPPVALLVSLVLRARLIEESVRQLARGDFARALPSVDGAHLSGILLDLDGMRRTLHGQLRDLGLSSEEQDRNLGLARRSLQELTVGVGRQVTAVEETARVAAPDERVADAPSPRTSRCWPSSAEESSASILEMAAANYEVSDNMATLASSVQESASSIEEMTFSIKEVAKNVEALSLHRRGDLVVDERDGHLDPPGREQRQRDRAPLRGGGARRRACGVDAHQPDHRGHQPDQGLLARRPCAVIARAGAQDRRDRQDPRGHRRRRRADQPARAERRHHRRPGRRARQGLRRRRRRDQGPRRARRRVDQGDRRPHQGRAARESKNAIEAVQRGARSVDEGVKVVAPGRGRAAPDPRVAPSARPRWCATSPAPPSSRRAAPSRSPTPSTASPRPCSRSPPPPPSRPAAPRRSCAPPRRCDRSPSTSSARRRSRPAAPSRSPASIESISRDGQRA